MQLLPVEQADESADALRPLTVSDSVWLFQPIFHSNSAQPQFSAFFSLTKTSKVGLDEPFSKR
jgi:hypothetical protein